MDEKEVLNKTVDTLVQDPLVIRVKLRSAGNMDKILIKTGLKKPEKTFEIPPLVYAKGMRITKELIGVDPGFLTSKNVVSDAIKLLADHGELVPRCLAIAVGDPRKEPARRLIKFFACNMTPADGAAIIGKLVEKADLTSFMSTIISATGMSLLKPREIIARGGSSEG